MKAKMFWWIFLCVLSFSAWVPSITWYIGYLSAREAVVAIGACAVLSVIVAWVGSDKMKNSNDWEQMLIVESAKGFIFVVNPVGWFVGMFLYLRRVIGPPRSE